ncbi:MAG: peptidoglycan bridge formation glycyltransferase FemA/FemB family protein [Eggerthellaceae bacterium]|nr:peptidoglycan bridge formation glycyltransferase FemA/FemB family protein [Eggerthellaceae bacterium]
MQKPLQQSLEWNKFLEDLELSTFFRQEDDFTFLAELKTTPAGNYLYVPYGPFATSKDAFRRAYQALFDLAMEEKDIFVRVEPQDKESLETLKDFNAKKSYDINPADTWVLDLTSEKEIIIRNFTQGTRTRYNQFKKKGLTVTNTKDPDKVRHLVELQIPLSKMRKIATFDEDYLKTELAQDFASLYLVHYTPPESKKEEIIAASLFFDFGDTRYYMQSASNYKYRRLPATVALLTSALFDAKEKGLKKFDFWGIAPGGAPKDHPWAGFTSFKKSFGGEAVHYCGTWDLVCNSTKYRLYKGLRKANMLCRKIFKYF